MFHDLRGIITIVLFFFGRFFFLACQVCYVWLARWVPGTYKRSVENSVALYLCPPSPCLAIFPPRFMRNGSCTFVSGSAFLYLNLSQTRNWCRVSCSFIFQRKVRHFQIVSLLIILCTSVTHCGRFPRTNAGSQRARHMVRRGYLMLPCLMM